VTATGRGRDWVDAARDVSSNVDSIRWELQLDGPAASVPLHDGSRLGQTQREALRATVPSLIDQVGA